MKGRNSKKMKERNSLWKGNERLFLYKKSQRKKEERKKF